MTAADVIRAYLDEAEVSYEEGSVGVFTVSLPGRNRLNTVASLVVGDHTLTTNAFVMRHPDADPRSLHQWLLERNRKLNAVYYAIDQFGDVYLVGRLPLGAVSPANLDALLGAVLEYADGDFNTMLELGFADSIRAEWRWRLARGESTANLEAFRHLAESPSDQA